MKLIEMQFFLNYRITFTAKPCQEGLLTGFRFFLCAPANLVGDHWETGIRWKLLPNAVRIHALAE